VLAVGLLVLTLAPQRTGAPVAVSSTSSPGSATPPPLVASASLGRDVTTLARHPIATPIGDDGMALMSSRAIVSGSQFGIPRPDTRLIDVVLVSGLVTKALVVDPGRSGGIAWVSLDVEADDEPETESDGHGLDVAVKMPRADDVVTVLADPPMLVEFAHIEQVKADDGTPVIDDDGDVVGMCIQHDDGGVADFTPIGELVGDAPTGEQD
jgi:hypothetical protein